MPSWSSILYYISGAFNTLAGVTLFTNPIPPELANEKNLEGTRLQMQGKGIILTNLGLLQLAAMYTKSDFRKFLAGAVTIGDLWLLCAWAGKTDKLLPSERPMTGIGVRAYIIYEIIAMLSYIYMDEK